MTSLGPAYIKLGQALSIRPDILSPAAMTELQKLCDKVNIARFCLVLPLASTQSINLLLDVPEELKFANRVIYCYVKVPSFPDDIAMALLEEELGRPWHEIYSELSPSPIAAGNYTKI